MHAHVHALLGPGVSTLSLTWLAVQNACPITFLIIPGVGRLVHTDIVAFISLDFFHLPIAANYLLKSLSLALSTGSFTLVGQMTCTFPIAEQVCGQALTLHLVLSRVILLNAEIPAFFQRCLTLYLFLGFQGAGGILANAVEAAGLRQTGVAFPVAFEHAVAADPIADVPMGVVFWEAKIWTASPVGFFEAFALAGSVSRQTSAFAFIPVLHLRFRAAVLPTFEGVGLEAGPVAFPVVPLEFAEF